MPFYDDMQKVVQDVLSGEFAQGEIVYIRQIAGNGPADDPGEPVVQNFPINATANGVKFKYVQSGMAVASDLQVVAPVDPLYVPNIKDNVRVDGSTDKIHQLLPKPTAGTPVAYVFILRR